MNIISQIFRGIFAHLLLVILSLKLTPLTKYIKDTNTKDTNTNKANDNIL